MSVKLKQFATKLKFLWASAVDLLFDFVLGTIWFTIFITLLTTGLPMIFVLGIGVLIVFLAVEMTRLSGYVERQRTAAVYEISISKPVRRVTKRTDGWKWFFQALIDTIDPVSWRIFLHHVLSMVLGSIMFGIWSGGVGLFLFVAHFAPGPWPWVVAIGGLAVLIAYIYGAGLLDRKVSPVLLGPSAKSELRHKVESLADARQGAVDAASIERQRIERNLHDGVQPQLVSVALNLGMAKAKIDSDPQAAKALIEQAHSEAKASIADLRQLARGIHPSVLTDRGLDAALSAVASKCSVPTKVTVDIAGRSSAEAEAVIYFAVAEALTNVTKHSAATACTVAVKQVGEGSKLCRLVARIEDNGIGGAKEEEGLGRSGLAGMSDRVRASGGTLQIESPVGGPTVVTVEVPCES
ncbi:MAG: sensor domain-containing protein [Cryobacterium sp.]|nr:sensor domain-containing protein [Cryobacterium sp.]